MDGILNINKPTGMSSFDVVRVVKKAAKTKKVGHTGTLDPEASGVLPICIGRATKLVDYIMSDYKIYEVELKLGITTDTYDREGKVLQTSEVNLSENDVKEVIKSFVGEIDQVPPMYSALKVNGQRLYNLARQGIEIERKSRKVHIYNIDILSVDLPVVHFTVKCSKGTYIRSLCYDIGEKLKCGGTMWNLKRTQTGSFNILNSMELDQLNVDNIHNYLIPMDKALESYPKVVIDKKYEKLILNGVNVKDNAIIGNIETNKLYRVYLGENDFVGIGVKKDFGFKMTKLLVQG
ncbi:tRNA pseudouridine(55) synthase TruB [Clostridium magnum]|uniref:tRNA pseudouridine synthase B n=1 Tax=Clostridium magnum DSM 2767 TaxID=1121326 RepID=A0A162V2H9_9CLOT|nr:tRNA pseudouridine(55) synthase TruB [Clostridium magnum]KZL94491.1 tRNA pseudouridine synthase B [Clostridium magnum DSM 2767]SHI21768.1 tRNA pseudouridine55 synthase [Clostridium magnum DSM 2767]